jgi:type IX secretion system PorP/SprF family membrane protein
MKRKNNISIFIFLWVSFIGNSLTAQLELPYVSSLFYGTITNPAHAEKDSAVQIIFLNRDQWNGVLSAPKSQLISSSIPLSNTSKIGANIFRNTAGVSERFSFDVFYNYTVRVNEGRLRLGILASIQQERRDFTKEDILLNDPLSSDELIAEGIISFTSFNTGIGMHYDYNNFNFGLSLPRLLADRLGLFGSEKVSNNTPLFAYVNAFIPLRRGYKIRNRVNLQFDSNQYSLLQYLASFNYRNQLDAGVQLNSQITNGFNLQSIDFLVSIAIHRNFSLGLSYGVPLSPISRVTPGSFEVFLSYLIPTE